MREFDVSKHWVILAPRRRPSADLIEGVAARELADRLGYLRGIPIPILPADSPAPSESTPIIVLNAGNASNGFSWRAGEERVEIYGDSPKGLLNGVFDFLRSLGFGWDGSVRLPPAAKNGGESAPARLPLAKSGAYEKAPDGDWPRVVERAGGETPEGQVMRAAWSGADAVLLGGKREKGARRLAAEYGLFVEAAGPRPDSLLSKLLFPFRADLFRMESGRRRTDRCFCPTNPQAAALAARQAARFFKRSPRADIYRFVLEGDPAGRAICACPSCRAFSPAEQAILAANAAAVALEETAAEARLLLDLELPEEEHPLIPPRGNLILRRRPAARQSGQEPPLARP